MPGNFPSGAIIHSRTASCSQKWTNEPLGPFTINLTTIMQKTDSQALFSDLSRTSQAFGVSVHSWGSENQDFFPWNVDKLCQWAKSFSWLKFSCSPQIFFAKTTSSPLACGNVKQMFITVQQLIWRICQMNLTKRSRGSDVCNRRWNGRKGSNQALMEALRRLEERMSTWGECRLIPVEGERHESFPDHSSVVRPGCELLTNVAAFAEAHCNRVSKLHTQKKHFAG